MPNYLIDQINKVKDKDLMKCSKCKCTWFHQAKYSQFSDSMTVIIGQEVPSKGPEFILFTCAKCGEHLEPRLLRMHKDSLDKKYDEFYKDLNET
jgi:hypothetical protein